MNAIKTINLKKKYGKFLAVDNLNITVKKGQVYGFIGKNGAGKTTTINMILSLLKPTSGELYINEELINFEDYKYKELIGFVADVPVFPTYMNAKEYLTYVGELFGMKGETLKKRVLEVLEFVGLENTRKLVKGYSRGMKQRLAIAAGIINDPEILVMDEPTSALDPIGRKQVLDIINKLRGKKTIFYSTHILNDVERVCDSICLIDKGEVIIEDSIENIKDKYLLNRFFIETSNNNLLYELLNKVSWIKFLEKERNGLLFEYNNKSMYEQEFLNILTKNNINLYELKRLDLNLEDIFMKVVNHEDSYKA